MGGVDEDETERRILLDRKRRLALVASMSEEPTRVRAKGLMVAAAKRFVARDSATDVFKVPRMKADTFRSLAASILGLKLTKLELGAIVLDLYGLESIERGEVPSDEFIQRFITAGIEERKLDLLSRRQREQESALADSEKSRQREQRFVETTKVSVDLEFTEADEARALEKLTLASVKFDRSALMTAERDAFESSVLTPQRLRDGLKLILSVSLSKKEVSALFSRLSGEAEKGNSPLTGLLFLRTFIKLGDSRRQELRVAEQKERASRTASAQVASKYEEPDTADTVFTHADVRLGVEKVKAAAAIFNGDRGSRLSELYGCDLQPAVLRTLLRRELDIALSQAEASGVASLFLAGPKPGSPTSKPSMQPWLGARSLGSAVLSGSAFVAYFLRQVTEEKKNRRVAQAIKELSKRVDKSAREEERLKDERGSPDYGFDEDFRRDTLWRLSNFAGRYERFSASAVSLDPFYGLEMTPAVLRQTLFRIVGIRLSNKELGVLVREFAKPDTDVVHSSEFLLAFLRAGVEQREVWHKAKAEKQQERERKVKAELAYTKEHGEKESEVGAVDHAFTAADSASARDKLVRASLAYDKLSSTAPSLQVFESGVMTASKLRDNLRKVFNVYLSARELGAVMKDFDAKGEGYVRSRDFVRGFLRLGTEKRAEVQRQNVSSRARSPTTKQSTEKEGPTSEETVADWRFEPEHFDAAAAKLETALLHGDATGMAALNGIRMNPVELQTFLQKSLRVALDPLELGALMNRVGVSLSVESTSRAAVDSLVLKGLLLRLRHTAKAKEQQKMNADKRRLREEEEARVHRLALLEEQRLKASSEYFFSEEDRVQALSRLSAVAMKYDKSSPGSVSLEGFRRAFLSPAEFVQTLRLTFNLALDQKEASALVEQFEYKDSGSLDCAAFVNAFIKMGTEERSKHRLIQLEKQRRKEAQERSAHERKMKEIAAKKELPLDFAAATDADKERALAKLKAAATAYDKGDPSAVPLDGFFAAHLSAAEFREQLKRTFGAAVTAGELCSLMSFYGGEESRSLDCAKFLAHFLRLGTVERQKIRAQALKKQREAVQAMKKTAEDKVAARDGSYWLGPSSKEFSSEDDSRAIAKLNAALVENNVASIGADCLSAYRCESLDIDNFCSSLRSSLGLRLSSAEWQALLSHFEVAGSGKVACITFLSYVKTAVRAHSPSRSPARTQTSAAEGPQLNKTEDLRIVDYDYTAEDFSAALLKIRECCSHIGPGSSADLKAFVGPDMQPSEFKELASRCLGMSLRPKELGALCRYFQAADGVRVSSTGFVTHFNRVHRGEWERNRKEVLLTNKQKAKLEVSLQQRSDDAVKAKVPGFGPRDEESFSRKLIEAVGKYTRNPASYVGCMNPFRGTNFGLEAFKEVFSRTFLVSFSSKECAVLLSAFDAIGSGTIDGSRFLNSFYRLARDSDVTPSTADVLGSLRLHNISKPLTAQFNKSPNAGATKPDSPGQQIKIFDSLSSLNPVSVDRKELPKKTKQAEHTTAKSSDPLHSIDNAVFLMPRKMPAKPSARAASRTVPPAAQAATQLPKPSREFVFPALLSSAPVFILPSAKVLDENKLSSP